MPQESAPSNRDRGLPQVEFVASLGRARIDRGPSGVCQDLAMGNIEYRIFTIRSASRNRCYSMNESLLERRSRKTRSTTAMATSCTHCEAALVWVGYSMRAALAVSQERAHDESTWRIVSECSRLRMVALRGVRQQHL